LPLTTVRLDEPEATAVKSKPIPERTTVASLLTVLLLMVRFPVCATALVGTNVTPAVQLACGSSEDPQVLFTNWKPVGTVRTRRSKLFTVPELVTVTVVELLVAPTPVVAKLIDAGVA
jgi:hypothetical protein